VGCDYEQGAEVDELEWGSYDMKLLMAWVGLAQVFCWFFSVPLCCQLTWSIILGLQYVGTDAYLLLRLLILPKLSGCNVPKFSIYQKAIIAVSPILSELISEVVFRLVAP
jgi:hypothetical protein